MKTDKTLVLYSNNSINSYVCKNCIFYLPEQSKCFLHGVNDEIKPNDSCNHFIAGDYLYGNPLGVLSKLKSGFISNILVKDVRCYSCASFLPDQKDCELVNKNSIGEDLGFINENACCNLWSTEKQLVNIQKKTVPVNSNPNNNNKNVKDMMDEFKRRLPNLSEPLKNNTKKGG